MASSIFSMDPHRQVVNSRIPSPNRPRIMALQSSTGTTTFPRVYISITDISTRKVLRLDTSLGLVYVSDLPTASIRNTD